MKSGRLSKNQDSDSREAMMTPADEQDLIHRARRGDQHAFGRLVRIHMKLTYNLAYRFINDHYLAEEIAQEAFVRAFQSIGSFRGDCTFRTWLHRIVVNLSLNAIKRKKRTPELHYPVTAGSPEVGTTETEHSIDDFRSPVWNALSELPPLQRTVVILRHLEGESTRDVSRMLNCSEGTVKTHLFRGLKKLRHKLGFLQGEIAG